MTWREILQELKAKAKVEGETRNEDKAESQADILGSMPHAKSVITWRKLLLLLVEERCFFSVRQDRKGTARIMKEKSSGRVVEYFLEKAWERPILGSQQG